MQRGLCEVTEGVPWLFLNQALGLLMDGNVRVLHGPLGAFVEYILLGSVSTSSQDGMCFPPTSSSLQSGWALLGRLCFKQRVGRGSLR